jgi:hypothetical protein
LGLPASAPLSAVYEADASARRAAKLGTERTTPWDLAFAGPVVRGEAEARDAVGRLTEPVQRLKERLLWVHECEGIASASRDRLDALAAAATGPAKTHDVAFFKLLAICVRDPAVNDCARWADALAAWKACVDDDGYWTTVIDAEMDGGFEPMAGAQEIQELRRKTLSIIADVPSAIAREAMAAGLNGIADRALIALSTSKLPTEVVGAAQDEVLRPLVETLERLSTEIGNACSEKVSRIDSDEVVPANLAVCDAAMARFDKEVHPRLAEIVTMAGTETEVGRQAREIAAVCLRRIATDLTWAEAFDRAVTNLKRASVLAEGSASQARIATELAQVQETARKQTEPVCTVDIGGTALVIRRNEITFGKQKMPVKMISQIRFGIFEQYTNGVRTNRSYAIWLSDGRSTISIECAKGRAEFVPFVAKSVSDSVVEARWKQALDGVWQTVMARLIDNHVEALKSGKGFQIGGLTFDKEGIHRRGQYSELRRSLLRSWVSTFRGKSAEQRERDHLHVRWEDVTYHSAAGHVMLYHQHKQWARFALRDTWNAVLIDPMLGYLWKDGRLWDAIGRRPSRV